ncbi:hypothetical protein KRP22_009517 [Phytophthora ramorum]|uniref:uncharacterized protein n=1 Tax=Phytophthora ramorum TaxID=164328 RepID=UPI0030AF3AD5|nr:hypothetical protein KRP23_13695 [Phytophthora ramorum]KAH7502890.1 hypothetical protein KRP22_8350 [Phytophthora ramorum]
MPSVHPIETLSKKLRQQAMELTHVYEELEKQNLQIDAYKQQIQDQKLQLEQLRAQRRKSIDGSSRAPTSSRATALEQQKRATQMMIGTPSTGASLGQKRGELERKVKEAEKEKKKYELAAKRIEKALVELQVFQNDRMGKLLPPDGVSDDEVTASGDLESVLNEQRAYIRVLEEAVHLKATDFEVTGHEELLIVLAELRHTIYEQEKDVEQKSKLVLSIQEQLEHEQQQHLMAKNLVTTAQKQQDEMAQRFHEQESALHTQIDEVRLQLQQNDSRRMQLEGVSNSAQRTEEALQSRLAAATKTHNLMDSKLEDAARKIKALQEQLDATSTKYAESKQQSESLLDACAKKQSHLDEMNALQEELLGSVDKYVAKAKKARDKVGRLEVELQACKEKEALVQQQVIDAAQSSDGRIEALQAKVDAAERHGQEVQTKCAALLKEKKRLENTLAEVQMSLEGQVQENSEQLQEIAAKQQNCHQVEEAVAELEAALSTALRMMLNKPVETSERQGIGDDDETSADTDEHAFLLDHSVLLELPIGERAQVEVNRALASWARERTNLVEACSMLDATAKMCQDEMKKRHDDIRDHRQQLMERTSEVEALAMQIQTLDEHLRRADAECEAYHALEQHATNQENALQAKQALIRDLSAENDRLVAVENAYSVQVAANARHSEQLEDQQEAMKEQRQYGDELERALENAATFAEQQNECNQQLSAQLAQLESSKREQVDCVKTLEVQNSAFSSRFMALVKHYTSFLRPSAATDRRLQDHLNLFDSELQNGDVLGLIQQFPALMEAYISICSRNPQQDRPSSSRVPPNRHSKLCVSTTFRRKEPQQLIKDIEMATSTWHSPAQEASPPKTSSSPSSPLEIALTRSCEEAQLAEKLELIRGTFRCYKNDLETDR